MKKLEVGITWVKSSPFSSWQCLLGLGNRNKLRPFFSDSFLILRTNHFQQHYCNTLIHQKEKKEKHKRRNKEIEKFIPVFLAHRKHFVATFGKNYEIFFDGWLNINGVSTEGHGLTSCFYNISQIFSWSHFKFV